MVSPLWLERYRQELSRRKLPPDYVERLVQELDDHFTDITEEGMSTEAIVCSRLGEPEVVAAAAFHEFRQRSVLNRRPLVAFSTFVLLPIPLLAFAWASVIGGLFLIGEMIPDAEKTMDIAPSAVVFSDMFVTAIVVLPPAVLAVFYAWLARKTVRRWMWTMVPCLMLAMMSGMIVHKLTFSTEPGMSMIMLGLPLGSGARFFGMTQLAQFAVPFGIGLFALRRPRFVPISAGE